MDTQNANLGSLPPGYSADDIVTSNGSEPLTNQGNLPPGYSPDDIIMAPAAPAPSNEIHVNSDDSTLTKVGKYVGGTLEGIGEGMFGTAAGAADIVNKVTGQQAGGFTKALHELAGDDQQHSAGQGLGEGLETIGEFLMGDAALKGLSFADKLAKSSKVMKLIENSPRLAQALRLGINVGKAGAELSPEERALLQKYPTLARLAGVGLESVRQGITQGIQTTVKSGGDVGKGAKEGLEMGAASAALGAPLATVGGLLAKGGEAAKTAEGLRTAAEAAPTSVEANKALESAVQGTQAGKISEAEALKKEAEEKLAGAEGAISGINAPTKEEITSKAQQSVRNAEANLSTNYENAAESIHNDLKDKSIPFEGSKFQNAIQEILTGATGETDDIKKALGASLPVSEKMAKNLEAIGNAEDRPLTSRDLLDFAKLAKERIRSLGYGTEQERIDRDAWFDILDGIHQSFGDLAATSGVPGLPERVNAMNAAYKEGITNLKHPDVRALLSGSKENAIINYLTGGKSVGDIKTIKKSIGQTAFSRLADDAMSRLAADAKDVNGNFDIKRWVRDMNKIPAEVRQEMFEGTTKSGALENILRQVQSVQGSGVIENADASIKESQDLMKSILGSEADLKGMLKDPSKVQLLSQTVGPEAMGELGNTILNNQLREAATVFSKDGTPKISSVDTGKFMNFINSLKDSPEVVEAFFRPTPERAEAYAKLLQSVSHVQRVKEILKLGIIAPALGATIGGIAGHTGLSLLLGAAAAETAGGSVKFARDILEHIANNPKTWGALKGLSKATQSPTASVVSRTMKAAAGKYVAPSVGNYLANTQVGKYLSNAFKGTSTQLGQ